MVQLAFDGPVPVVHVVPPAPEPPELPDIRVHVTVDPLLLVQVVLPVPGPPVAGLQVTVEPLPPVHVMVPDATVQFPAGEQAVPPESVAQL